MTKRNPAKKKNKLMMKEELKEAQNVSEREDILSRIGYKELMAMVQSFTSKSWIIYLNISSTTSFGRVLKK